MEPEKELFVSLSEIGLLAVIAISMLIGIGIGTRIMESRCRTLLNNIKVVNTINN